MVDCSGCPDGFCTVRNQTLPRSMQTVCRSGNNPMVDRMLERIAISRSRPREPQPTRVPRKSSTSAIGTVLSQIIKDQTGLDIPCSACKEEVQYLNTMTPEAVLADIDNLSQRIYERSKSNAQKWYQKLIINYAPELVIFEIRRWIRLACTREKYQVAKSTMRWEYGITTVKSRSKDLFPRTLESLMNAGFDTPRVFVDGCTPSESDSIYKPYNLPLTIRDNVRTAGNWVLSMYELYIRNPAAERYAIFQDDFVTVRNLRRYLELVPYPSEGYQNLYTFPSNQSIAPPNHKGWYPANQLGKGAVALVFSNEAVRVLLGQDYLVNRFQSNTRGHKAIDGGIVDAMKGKGWKEYVHTPSLTQHTGDKSSMGNMTHQKAISFPGEDFDALELLK